jgi:hypothetical protein
MGRSVQVLFARPLVAGDAQVRRTPEALVVHAAAPVDGSFATTNAPLSAPLRQKHRMT